MAEAASMPIVRLSSLEPVTIVGDGQDPRVMLFQQALISAGQAPASVIEYKDLLAGRVRWERAVCPSGLVRIESPGRCSAIRREMLIRGRRAAVLRGMDPVCPAELDAVDHDKGRIVGPVQWYLGCCDALAEIETAVACTPGTLFTTQPADIALLFDKRACRARLAAAGVPVPPSLGQIHGYEDLRARMEAAGWARIYLKLNHGSAGSGVIAYEANGQGREQAFTSVEMVGGHDGIRLYNSRRIRRYTMAVKVALLIDHLCRHDVHTEAWVPKAGLDNRRLDLRIVTIAARPTHVAVRMSPSPLTNLHLGNTRADPRDLMRRMGPENWQRLMNTCTAVSRLFPRTLHLGIDVAVTAGFRRHVVLEVNAFGDLLKAVSVAGMGTYDAEIKALLNGWGRSGRQGLSETTGTVRC